MDVQYSLEQRALRQEFRAYLGELMTPAVREAIRDRESGGTYRSLLKRMGQDGWLTPGWPKEYGGRGLDPLAQKIILEELWLAEAPFPFVTVNTIGPALIRRGTPAQKRDILPKIASGELNFAIGYSEAQAGTDLAALKTQAVRDGEFFVINGQKVFTSGAEGADYIWLAARTDPAAAAHRGISILMVDTGLPGFAVSPIHTVGGIRTNVTYYNDVRVPADDARGGAERWLAAHHRAAQPRARGAGRARLRGAGLLRCDARLGARDALGRRLSGRSALGADRAR